MSLLRAPLSAWYRRARRDLPWRRAPSPYRILVSEFMLQQTTVAAAAPRFERFLRRFPGPAALARASERSVLAEWAGLGYYARARNLRRAARRIVSEHGGRVPSELAALRALPGVGAYTAAAVGSIAFGRPWPLADGNVTRVFARLFALPGRAKDPALLRRVWALAGEHLDRKAPGDWNQALMELGAVVCLPAAPRCGECPVAALCAARRGGRPEAFPAPPAPAPKTRLKLDLLWIEERGRVLLWKRGPEETVLKGQWSPPEAGRLAAAPRPGAPPARARHSITRYAVEAALRPGRLRPGARPPPEARWFPASRARGLLLSSLWRKLLARLPSPPSQGPKA